MGLRAEITAFFDDLSVPFRALLVSLVGVGLAWLWFNDLGWLAVLASVAVLVAGRLLEGIGRYLLPDYPLWGLRFMELWVITPAMFAAVSAGAIVVLAVQLSVPDTASTAEKELMSSLAAGITGFLTAGFVSWSGDQKDSPVADRIKNNFQEKYKRGTAGQTGNKGIKYFKADSPGERFVYSEEFRGTSGWGRSARLKRARGIADELRSGFSNP